MKFSDVLAHREKIDPTNIVGYASGVFDLLHCGHLNYLKSCSLRCACLIVGVDVDELVRSKKGYSRPVQPENVRLAKVLSTPLAIIGFFKVSSSEEILSSLHPNLYFIPDNRELGQQRMSMIYKLGIELVRIPYTEGISTSAIINRAHE